MVLAMGQISAFGSAFLVTDPASNPSSTSLTMAWNPSPDPAATGYTISYGLASGSYTGSLDAGNATNATLDGLDAGATYYFVVTAYDATGRQSLPSNEVVDTTPLIQGTGAAVPAVKNSLLSNLLARQNLGIRALQSAVGSGVQLSFQGLSGGTYRVEASSDLQTWENLWITNCGSDGAIKLEVTNLADHAQRFYRLVKE